MQHPCDQALWRASFIDALRLVGEAAARLPVGASDPILCRESAVELYTGGLWATDDLELSIVRVSRMVRSRLDIDFNLHLLRSLLATLFADANPGDIQTAQIKLGHKNARTTQRFYIDADQRNAHRRFDAVIDDLVELRTKPTTRKSGGPS